MELIKWAVGKGNKVLAEAAPFAYAYDTSIVVELGAAGPRSAYRLQLTQDEAREVRESLSRALSAAHPEKQ